MQFANQKDAVAFLIDASETMLQPADPATQPPDWDESLPWRAIDLALHLTQTTMRSKCVRRRGAGAGVRAASALCPNVCARARALGLGAQDRVQRERPHVRHLLRFGAERPRAARSVRAR